MRASGGAPPPLSDSCRCCPRSRPPRPPGGQRGTYAEGKDSRTHPDPRPKLFFVHDETFPDLHRESTQQTPTLSRAKGSSYSHSMVPGGLLVTSRTTRFTSGTSLVMRVEIRSSTSYGTRVQSAVIASSLDTGRSTIGWP